MQTYETERVRLRDWLEADLVPFAAMNADPEVTEFLPGPMTRAESDGFVDRIRTQFQERGFGLFAAEERESGEFMGFVGLAVPSFEASFTPCVEVGWRLARAHWGKGYATEAAREVLRIGFAIHGLSEIVSFTVPQNVRSQAVMQKLGMRHDPTDDFEHPRLPKGHRLRSHVLYRMSNDGGAANA